MSVRSKSCGHHECALDLDQCCACTDKREERERGYLVYVDGQGMVEGHRWSFYCNACKSSFQEATHLNEDFSQSVSEASEASAHTNRRMRVLANYQRTFGTREDIEADEYESPLSKLFSHPIPVCMSC